MGPSSLFSSLTGTGKLVRLILRRDRVVMPLWVGLLALVPLADVGAIGGLFPTAAARHSYYAASVDSPLYVSLYGRPYGSTLGELVAWRVGFVAVVIALASVLMVIRHTRAEEEAGRTELLGATVVGRHAGLAAALFTTLGANLVLGVLIALFTSGDKLPVAGSWVLGTEFALVGWVFAALAAVVAQATNGARTARAIAVTVLGAAYVLRIAGDVSAIGNGGVAWLSWLSPLYWMQQMRPYGAGDWWPVLVAVGTTVVLSVVAVRLSARRDVGAGLLPSRLGPPEASPALGSPLGLAWRLHRGLLLAWVVGFAVLGVVFGSAGGSIQDFVNDNKAFADIFARLGGGGGVVDSYLAGMLSLLGLVAAGYAVQATLRLREEEASGRLEPVLSVAVSRLRWAGSHLTFSVLGPAAALAAGGLGMGLTRGLATGHPGHEIPRLLLGAMLQLPAVWVLVAVALALFGLRPRWAAASWVALAACFLFGLIGSELRLSHWLLDVSPFTHIPRVPGATLTATPLVALAVLAALLGAVGLVGLRRRDMPVG